MHRLTFVAKNQMFSSSILKAEVYLSDTYQYGIPSVAFAAVSAAVTSTKVRCPSYFNSSPGRSARASEQRRRQLEILLNIRRLCTTYRATYRGKSLATAVKWSRHCYGSRCSQNEYTAKLFDGVTTSASRSSNAKSIVRRGWKKSLFRQRERGDE